jgi:hypothetical protein
VMRSTVAEEIPKDPNNLAVVIWLCHVPTGELLDVATRQSPSDRN